MTSRNREFGFFARGMGAPFEDAPGEVTREAQKAERSAVLRRTQAKRDAG